MPQPKKKMTSTRSGKRRGQINLSEVTLIDCAKCKTAIKPHTVCYVCGNYQGENVIDMAKKEKKIVEHDHEHEQK
jgi:ribosomal protein L32